MSLLDLKTDLKSLKYGQDQPGGGSSGQPFIQIDVNNPDRIARNGDDGFIRGGFEGATKASTTDLLRINKFFFKNGSQGYLFLARQAGLQLSNPLLETRQFNTIGGGGFLAGVANVAINIVNLINREIGPTRVYNFGVNTLAQVPLNAFGGHLSRHGILPIQPEEGKYEAVVRNNAGLINDDVTGALKNNRLLKLTTKFQLGDRETNQPITRNSNLLNTIGNIFGNVPIVSTVLNLIKPRPAESIIDKYIGGPGSVYGVGETLIRRHSYTEDSDKINLAKIQSNQYAGKTRDDKGAGIPVNYTSDLGKGNNAIFNYGDGISTDENEINAGISGQLSNSVIYNNPSLKTYTELQRKVKYVTDGNRGSTQDGDVNKFGIYNTQNRNENFNYYLPTSPDKPVYYNGKETVKIKIPWNEVYREKRIGSGRKDEINLTPLFHTDTGTYGDKVNITGVGEKYNIRDLVKFRIQAVKTDDPNLATWMVFRAYLTDLSDDVSADWQDVKYAGRGDKFYIYNGFTRKMSIGFKVAALSSVEMKPMYQKLNYLMGNLMPDYSNNLMRGPLVRMTVGNYIDGQLGVLNSLNYKVSQDTPWEIALTEPEGGIKTLVLPHIIEVSLGFTPIGSQTRNENKISSKTARTSHIAQNWNGKNENNDFINPDRSSILEAFNPPDLNIKPPSSADPEPPPPPLI